MRKTCLFLGLFLTGAAFSQVAHSWSWDSGDNVLPSLREELDKEITAYRDQVGLGITLHERIIILNRLIGNYKPIGLNVVDLESERGRLMLQEKQEQLRSVDAQDEATTLYERGVAEYRDGQYQVAVETMRQAERLLPDDQSIKEIRRKLEAVSNIVESETSAIDETSKLIRLAVTRFVENDPRRSVNAFIYATEKDKERRQLHRLKQLVENNHPEIETLRLPSGIGIVDHKLQTTLEAIYDGRYLTAISECTDVLDLEPENVMALTRLGSAYYAMNEKSRAKQVWTKALQYEPENEVLKKFLYGRKGRASAQ